MCYCYLDNLTWKFCVKLPQSSQFRLLFLDKLHAFNARFNSSLTIALLAAGLVTSSSCEIPHFTLAAFFSRFLRQACDWPGYPLSSAQPFYLYNLAFLSNLVWSLSNEEVASSTSLFTNCVCVLLLSFILIFEIDESGVWWWWTCGMVVQSRDWLDK